MKKIGISTDCMCDLPEDSLKANDIHVMQFYIHTATGRFWNESEITSDNILEYLSVGNVVLRCNVPEPGECREYFENLLTRYDQVIHITASDKIGLSHPNAKIALELMGDEASRVTLINSGAVSTGLGHMVMLVAALRDSGKSIPEMIEACDAVRGKIFNSFIVPNADYLHRMGYASHSVRGLCRALKIHPVLSTRNGKISVKSIRIGNYERAVMRYLRSELRRSKKIDKRQLFITHAGCPAKTVAQITEKVEALHRFDSITVTKASVVISSWCGPETVGVQFVYE